MVELTTKIPLLPGSHRTLDTIAVEAPYNIFLNNCFWQRIFCTPSQLTELVTGLLWDAGLLRTENDLLACQIEDEQQKIDVKLAASQTQHLALPQISPDDSIQPDMYFTIMAMLESRAILFRETGAVHSGLLCQGVRPIHFAEDISRHHVFLKLVGYSLLHSLPSSDKTIALTCRLTESIVTKGANWGIGLMLSRSAATSAGIAVAQAAGMHLVGFIRDHSMNCYC